jgi:hypothetical protein
MDSFHLNSNASKVAEVSRVMPNKRTESLKLFSIKVSIAADTFLILMAPFLPFIELMGFN